MSMASCACARDGGDSSTGAVSVRLDCRLRNYSIPFHAWQPPLLVHNPRAIQSSTPHHALTSFRSGRAPLDSCGVRQFARGVEKCGTTPISSPFFFHHPTFPFFPPHPPLPPPHPPLKQPSLRVLHDISFPLPSASQPRSFRTNKPLLNSRDSFTFIVLFKLISIIGQSVGWWKIRDVCIPALRKFCFNIFAVAFEYNIKEGGTFF